MVAGNDRGERTERRRRGTRCGRIKKNRVIEEGRRQCGSGGVVAGSCSGGDGRWL